MHQNIGLMVIGAGIVGTLLEFVKNHRRDLFLVRSLLLSVLVIQC